MVKPSGTVKQHKAGAQKLVQAEDPSREEYRLSKAYRSCDIFAFMVLYNQAKLDCASMSGTGILAVKPQCRDKQL